MCYDSSQLEDKGVSFVGEIMVDYNNVSFISSGLYLMGLVSHTGICVCLSDGLSVAMVRGHVTQAVTSYNCQ